MSSFFEGIPRELEESVRVYGCSRIGALFRIIIPVAAGGIVVTAVFVFLASWNEYLFSLLLSSTGVKTAPIAIAEFKSQYGIQWGTMTSLSVLYSLPVSLTFGERRGPKGPFSPAMNWYFPMPFGKHARIHIINESEEPIANLFYYVDYELYDDAPPEDVGYFHATWNHENPTSAVEHPSDLEDPAPWDLPSINLTGEENYVILDAVGTGHYVGCVLNIDNFNASNQVFTWPGEGDDMFFIDGESWPPSLHGTGTEDYFGAAWGFPSGEYAGPYHGISLGSDVQEHFGKWSLYRWHIEDPIHFTKSLRFSIEHGHANDQSNEFSSVAYWYQLEPHKPLPQLPPVEARLPRRWPEHGLWDR